jgi:hypothetical protein
MPTHAKGWFARLQQRYPWMRRPVRRGLVGAWYLALVATILLVPIYGFMRPTTSVAIDAQTEYVSFEATEGYELSWDVTGFELNGCPDPQGAAQSLKGVAGLQVGRGVVASFTKMEGATEVDIDLVDSRLAAITPAKECDGRSAIWLVQSDSTQKPLYGAHMHLHRSDPDALPRVFPIWGAVTLGQDPSGGKQALLISGQASLHASNKDQNSSALYTWLFGSLSYVPETAALQRGDLILPPVDPQGHAGARGFVRVPAKDPLQVGYYIKTGDVIVQRPGNATLELDLPLWDRFKYEPRLSTTLGILVALLGLGQLGTDIGESWRYAFKRESPSESSPKLPPRFPHEG